MAQRWMEMAREGKEVWSGPERGPASCSAPHARRAAQRRYDDLWDAADCGDVDAVRRMLADGAGVGQRPGEESAACLREACSCEMWRGGRGWRGRCGYGAAAQHAARAVYAARETWGGGGVRGGGGGVLSRR